MPAHNSSAISYYSLKMCELVCVCLTVTFLSSYFFFFSSFFIGSAIFTGSLCHKLVVPRSQWAQHPKSLSIVIAHIIKKKKEKS